MNFRLGLAQIKPKLGDVRSNLDKHEEIIEQARAEHVDLLVFPELALTGYYVKDMVPSIAASPVPDDPLFGPLLQASGDTDLVVSFVEKDSRGRYYISGAYLSGKRVVHLHRKVYLPTYRLFEDGRYFAAGNSFRAFDTRFGRMGLTICEDAWHLSSAYLLWQDGADFLLDIASSPGYGLGSTQSGQLGNELTVSSFLRTYAELMTMFVFYVNRVGVEDGISFWGGSAVVAPDGTSLAQAPLFDEHLLTAEIDSDSLRRARLRLPTLRDERTDMVRRELHRVLEKQSSIP